MCAVVDDLKRCPFCEYVKMSLVTTNSRYGYPAMSCLNCGAQGPMARTGQAAEAEELWNQRPFGGSWSKDKKQKKAAG